MLIHYISLHTYALPLGIIKLLCNTSGPGAVPMHYSNADAASLERCIGTSLAFVEFGVT